MLRLVDVADLRNVVHLEVEHSHANERRDQRRNKLCTKCVPRWNLRVMRELEILAEMKRMRARHVAICLEEVHSKRVTGNPRATDELCEHIEGDFHASNSHDQPHGDDKEQAERDAVEDDASASVRLVACDATDAKGHCDEKHGEVEPFGDFVVPRHETVVHVLVDHASLLSEEMLQPHPDLLTMPEVGVGHSGDVDTEEEHVDGQIAGGEEGWRVGFVFGCVKQSARVNGSRDVVFLSKVVVYARRVDGQVSGAIRIPVPESKNDEHGNEHAGESIGPEEEGQHERRVALVEREHIPVEGRDRIQA